MDNITIFFSGYNIKWYAILAIESFLRFYPQLRENIVYFDDNSTDGTAEELEKRGIKIISWKYYTSKWEELLEYTKNRGYHENMSRYGARCLLILKEMYLQCKTKYCLINDGDIMFINGGFIEKYINILKKEDSVLCSKIEYCQYGDEDLDKINIKKFGYEKFLKKVTCNGYTYDGIPRIYFLHTFIDKEKLDATNIIFDTEDLEYLSSFGLGIDVGTDFYVKLVTNNIKFSIIDNIELSSYVEGTDYILVHWRWISSSNQKVHNLTTERVGYLEHVENRIMSEPAYSYIKSFGIHPMRLIVSLKNNINKNILI